jgi:hypothetical protein
MWTIEDQRVCSPPQSSITELLEPDSRSFSKSDRRVSTRMAEKRHVLTSTVETNPEGIENDTDTETKRSDPSDSVVAQSILVSNDTSGETSRSTNYSKNKQKIVSSRKAFINNFRRQTGLEEHLITVLNDSIRRSTRQVYDLGWNKWETWCTEQKPRINAL